MIVYIQVIPGMFLLHLFGIERNFFAPDNTLTKGIAGTLLP